MNGSFAHLRIPDSSSKARQVATPQVWLVCLACACANEKHTRHYKTSLTMVLDAPQYQIRVTLRLQVPVLKTNHWLCSWMKARRPVAQREAWLAICTCAITSMCSELCMRTWDPCSPPICAKDNPKMKHNSSMMILSLPQIITPHHSTIAIETWHSLATRWQHGKLP